MNVHRKLPSDMDRKAVCRQLVCQTINILLITSLNWLHISKETGTKSSRGVILPDQCRLTFLKKAERRKYYKIMTFTAEREQVLFTNFFLKRTNLSKPILFAETHG